MRGAGALPVSRRRRRHHEATQSPPRVWMRGRRAGRLRLVLATLSATGPASRETRSAEDQAARQVCGARDDIETQVRTLTSLSAGGAPKAEVTSALSAITTRPGSKRSRAVLALCRAARRNLNRVLEAVHLRAEVPPVPPPKSPGILRVEPD